MGDLIVNVSRVGPYLSEGARLLWVGMRREKVSQAELRRELDISHGLVGRWLRGERVPHGRNRRALEKRFGISLDDWERKPTKRFSMAAA